jgi:predicted nucleic acid-binding protein
MRIYWDACVWIALIKQETVTLKNGTVEKRYARCRELISMAEKGTIEIVTSAFTIAEVCKSSEVKNSGVDNLPTFFDKSYMLLVPVDKTVGVKAQTMQTSGIAGLKPPDAIHLASAHRANVDEMHSYDSDLLNLNGKITGQDGKPMRICKPGEMKPVGLFKKSE